MEGFLRGLSRFIPEIDVAVYDNFDENRILYACQCKHWEGKRKVGQKEIGEWIQTCRDLGAEPAFAALDFSTNAKRYAESSGVYLIDGETLDIEVSQIESNDYVAWKKELEKIDSDVERVLFCLKSIYQTEILQKAVTAQEGGSSLKFD